MAGDRAGALWAMLSPQQQQALLDYLRPAFYREGKRGALLSVTSVPVQDSSESAVSSLNGPPKLSESVREDGGSSLLNDRGGSTNDFGGDYLIHNVIYHLDY